MEHRAPRRRRARSGSITEPDRALLAFAAEHRFVTAAQVAVLLTIGFATARSRLRALGAAGLMDGEQLLHRRPAAHGITAAGLRAIGSSLPAPGPPDLALYRHDEGLAWLMLAARRGRFGPVKDVIAERRMRSADGRAAPVDERFGVRLGGYGPGGRERLHYPDMIIVTASGHRVAFELELTTKPPARRDEIIGAYAADRRIDAVVYLVESRAAGAAIERSARRAGVPELIAVQNVELSPRGRGRRGAAVRHREHARAGAGQREQARAGGGREPGRSR